MAFNMRGMNKVEPAFANAIKGKKTDEIHGVAIQLNTEDMAKLDQQEKGYEKAKVTVIGYDGRKVFAFLYTKRKGQFLPDEKQTPSARYLGVLVSGAEKAGLSQEYIQRLKSTRTYAPSEETLKRRAAKMVSPSTLREMSVAELAETKGDTKTAYVALFGFVLRLDRELCWFRSHLGRDLTARFSRHFRGVSMDKNDDMGRPPFPDESKMGAEERAYIGTWLDYYLDKCDASKSEGCGVVAFISEYAAQHAACGHGS